MTRTLPPDSGVWCDAICSHWTHRVDHLLWKCPTVRRFSESASDAIGRVDPFGTDLCGWCVRVWKARNPEIVAEYEATT